MLAPLNSLQINPLLHQLPQRAQLPQKAHPLPHRLQHIINLAFGCEPADAEPDAAVGALVAVAQRSEHVAGLEGGGGAGGARGEGNVLERHEERFAFDVGEGDVDAAGVVGGGGTIEGGVFEGEEAREEPVGERLDARGIVLWW